MALFAILAPSSMSAQDFEMDGIYYNFDDDNTATVTSGAVEYSGDVTIPATVTYNGTTYTVTNIAAYAFNDCRGLMSVTIPNTVRTIGYRAFDDCGALTSIVIPSSVTFIGEWAFRYCAGLTSIKVDSGNPIYDSRDDCNAIIRTEYNALIVGCKSTVIPNSVTTISEWAFQGCSGLTNVTIPNSVTSIGDLAFSECSGLASIIVESGNPIFDSRDNCNAIIATATHTLFAGCKNTVIPNSVVGIRYFAFNGCTGLTYVDIPNSVIYIDVNAFQGCTGLTDIVIPNSVTYIGGEAFKCCTGLENVTIPNSVTYIGSEVFDGCTNLTDVYSYITNLSGVTVGNNVFRSEGDYSGRTLHVPQGAAAAYQVDGKWYPYFGQIVEMDPAAHHPGDVNDDNEVNIADINAVIATLLDGDYNVAADVNGDGEITIADINAIIDIILGGDTPTPEGPDYVDLGLPSGTLWATRNVGAYAPEEGGDFFAWGETEPKYIYDMSTYKWSEGTATTLTKYCNNSNYGYNGFVDDKTELDPEDDAAYVHYPGGRMPSRTQIDELCDYCLWQWTQLNGVNGQLVTGPNGNSLFLPAAGYKSGGSLYSEGKSGYYWMRTMSGNPYKLYALRVYPNGNICNSQPRDRGFLVRAVYNSPTDGDNLYVKSHNLDLGKVPVGVTRTDQLTIFNGANEAAVLTVTADGPFLLKQEDGGASSMTVEVPGRSFVLVTVMFTADAPGDYSGNVTLQSPAFAGGQSVVKVRACAISVVEEHEYVDLGLTSGTLWATTNVGASAPEDVGDYFSWGETAPKYNYDWNTYKWCNGSVYTLIKYCTDSIYGCLGMVDGKTELEPADDAAWVNWGSSWRMPSAEQINELCEECTWQETTMNGVNGQLATGPNGNTIFLPKTGIRYRSAHHDTDIGYYWSRTLQPYETVEANSLRISTTCNSVWLYRYYGFAVRPVRATLE